MEPKKNEQKKTIPNRIALLRKQMGMSQKELADIVGVVQSTISVWENGQVAIDSNALPALSKALAVQVDYLLGLSDERQSNVRNALDTCNILSESCMDSRDSYYEYLYSIGIDVEKEKEEYLDHLHDVYMESESGVFFEAFQISKIFEHLNISERNRALEVQSTISVWENGQVAIDSNALPALSKALAVQVDYLLGLSDERQSNVRNALDTCNILSESCMDSRDSYYEYLYSIGIDVEKEKEEYLDHLHDVYMESESGVFFEAFQISKIFEHLNISERNRALEVIKLMFPQAAEKALTPDLSVLAAQHKKEQELNEEKENET